MVTSPVQRGYRQGRLHSSKDGMTEGRLISLFCLSSAHTSACLPSYDFKENRNNENGSISLVVCNI
jgi:hypothetical protein